MTDTVSYKAYPVTQFYLKVVLVYSNQLQQHHTGLISKTGLTYAGFQVPTAIMIKVRADTKIRFTRK